MQNLEKKNSYSKALDIYQQLSANYDKILLAKPSHKSRPLAASKSKDVKNPIKTKEMKTATFCAETRIKLPIK